MVESTVLLAIFLLVGDAFADEPKYWQIDLPTFDNAKKVEVTNSTDFWTKSVTYSLSDFDPKDVGSFYRNYFSKQGWKPGSDEKFIEQQGGWTSKSAGVTEENRPQSRLGLFWSHDDNGGAASLSIILTDYNKNKFRGSVTVSLSPNPMSFPPSFDKLSALLLDNPQNIFLLHKELGVDPAKILEVKIPNEDGSTSKGLLEDYYNILRQIRDDFRKFPSE